MPETLPAVLFDLDGTLIDSVTLIVESGRHAFVGFDGTVPSDAEWVAMMGTPLPTMFERYARTPERVAALIARYREYQHANHDRLIRCYDAVVDTVRTLHEAGHPIGIVTSKSEPLAARGLAHVGLTPHVDLVVGLESCRRHKPDPEPVRIALDRLKVEPRQALFVGDSPYDMDAGRAAGVWTAAVLWGPFGRAELEPTAPDFWLERMTELPAVVERLTGG